MVSSMVEEAGDFVADPPLLFFPVHAQPNGPMNINQKDGTQAPARKPKEIVTCRGWLRPGRVFGTAVLVLPAAPVAHKE
jgi:hypothetical protein